MNNFAPAEIRQQLEIIKELDNPDTEICPCCGNDVAHEDMTASVTRGVICQNCDISQFKSE